MREMKGSETGWLGEVPVDWKTDKLKYHLKRNEPRNPGDKTVLSLYRELGVIPKDSRDDNHNVTSEDTSNYKYVRPGDFVVNKMKAWQGSVAVSDYEGIVSPAYFIYNFTDNEFYKRYFHYLLRGCYKDEFMRLSGGIRVGQWDLPSSGLDNTIILIPSLSEQQSIAAYLDRKCAEIDTLAADIEKQIETLEQYKRSVITEAVTKGLNPDAEMKDSSIRWIGQMPVHWKTTRLKYCSTFSPKPLNRPKNENSVIEYLPMEFIKNGYYINNTEQMSNLPNSLTPFDEGDIVFAKVTPCFENGNIAIMNNLHNGYGVGSSELFVIRATSIYREFLFYWLQNSAFKAKAISTMTGMGGLKRVSGSFVQNSEIVFPSLSEQQAIAAYLDRKCAEIDSLIADKQTQLDTLAEYKKSLIYEYVTGKKEVPAV